jgi:hypothetical protein
MALERFKKAQQILGFRPGMFLMIFLIKIVKII